MHFTCKPANLQRGLALVGHAVPKGTSSLALLMFIRAEVVGGRLKLSATNLEISLTTWVQIEGPCEEGVIAIPAKLFTELISTVPEGDITFTANMETFTIQIKHACGTADMQGLSAEEFPPIPDASEGQHTVSLPTVALKHAIKGVSVSVADRNDARPTLTCVLTQVEAGKVTFATADGMRVSYDELLPPPGDVQAFGNVLIPYLALSELSSILPAEGTIAMSLTSNRSQVIFHTQGFTLCAILLNGEFPNYRSVVPKDRPLRVTTKTAEFLRIVQLTRLFAGKDQIAHLSITGSRGLVPGTVKVASERTEVGGGNNAIPAVVEGEDMEIAFNVKFLCEPLQAITTPDVALEIGMAMAAKTPAPAGFIRPVGAPGCVHCFMSLKVTDSQPE